MATVTGKSGIYKTNCPLFPFVFAFIVTVLMPNQHDPSKTTVLLAEDDLMIRNLVSLLLSREGYGVLTAVNGEEALELLKKAQSPIDLLITNVQMPIMDGVTLARTIRSSRPEVKIIIMTAEMDEQIREGNTLDAFLRKPFVPATLLRSIRRVLDGKPGSTIEV